MLAVAPPPRYALVPNAIAFSDPQHGIMGTGWQACAGQGGAFGCKPQGTISITTDGGTTWTVLLRTPRPVVAVAVQGTFERATFDDGETISSSDGGRHWTPIPVGASGFASQCPRSMQSFVSGDWVLCTGVAGGGSQSKSVYRYTASGLKRVAYTPFGPPGAGYGGIDAFGSPQGISMANNGFGVIWESRGTLYVTRDGGYHWIGLPHVARPDVDFGIAGVALRNGVGFVVLATGGTEVRRLIETTDAGRSWRIVHRWS